MTTAHPSFCLAARRGFTLIELMLVITIMGLLASVAIPNYREMQLRSKKAERAVVMNALAKGLREYFASHESLPTAGGNTTTSFSGAWNPALPVTAGSKRIDWTKPGWNQLAVSSFGNVYYHYYFYAYQSGAQAYFQVYAEGDLDANGLVNVRQQQWTLQAGTWSLTTDVETGDTY